MYVQAFNRSLDVPGQHHSMAVVQAITYVMSLASHVSAAHTTELHTLATSWHTSLRTVLTYIDNIIAHPSSVERKRINPSNPALLRRMKSLPLADVVPSQYQAWPALQLLSAVGFVEGSDGYLHLPADVTPLALAARAKELHAVLPMLHSVAQLEHNIATSMAAADDLTDVKPVIEKQTAAIVAKMSKALTARSSNVAVNGTATVTSAASTKASGAVSSKNTDTATSAATVTTAPKTKVISAPKPVAVSNPPMSATRDATPALAMSITGPYAAAQLLTEADAHVTKQASELLHLKQQVCKTIFDQARVGIVSLSHCLQVSELRTALDNASKASSARALYDTHELTAVQQDAAGSVSGDERVSRAKQLLQSVATARSLSPTTQRYAASRGVSFAGKQALNKVPASAVVDEDAAVKGARKQASISAAQAVVTALIADVITAACDAGEQFVLARTRQAGFISRNVHKPITVVTTLASYVRFFLISQSFVMLLCV